MSKNIHIENGRDDSCDYQRCNLIPFCAENLAEKKSNFLQLRLNFKSMPDVVYTGIPFGQAGASIEVILVDGLTGSLVKSGSEASGEVEILVLNKEFNKNDTDNWTSEEFEASILEGRQGKSSLLARTRLNLIEGCGSLGDIFFSHTRRQLPKTEVRLGARVVQDVGSCDGGRIREAVSETFMVKDRRAITKNDYQLSWTDDVSRLKNIGKGGPSHKNLCEEGIEKVGHFITKLLEDPQKLNNILAKTMSLEMLKTTINHAMTCEHEHIHLEAKHEDSKLVSDVHKIIDFLDAFEEPFNTLGAFFEDEFLWRNVDTDNIFRSFWGNEHQQFSDPFDPFQSTTFCSPTDLQNVLQGLALVHDVPIDRAHTQRGWKFLFAILRFLSIRKRIVSRKQSVRGIKRCRLE